MLSHDERRRLAAIERPCNAKTPTWPAASTRAHHGGCTTGYSPVPCVGLLAGLLTTNPAVLVVAGVLPTCAWLWLRRRGRGDRDQP